MSATSLSGGLKRGYSGAFRALRIPAQRSGLLAALEHRRSHRTALWLRSLFAIYNIDDMVHLDLPWWCFGAIEDTGRFLAARRGSARVLEWGSGASTVWLAKRAAAVVSLEHDTSWAACVHRLTASMPHVTLITEPAQPGSDSAYGSAKAGWRGLDFRAYVERADTLAGQFDLIVIDGRCRARCLEHALGRLAPGGRILFDNSGRRRYRDAIMASGLTATHFTGLAPGLPFPDRTTVLQAPG